MWKTPAGVIIIKSFFFFSYWQSFMADDAKIIKSLLCLQMNFHSVAVLTVPFGSDFILGARSLSQYN